MQRAKMASCDPTLLVMEFRGQCGAELVMVIKIHTPNALREIVADCRSEIHTYSTWVRQQNAAVWEISGRYSEERISSPVKLSFYHAAPFLPEIAHFSISCLLRYLMK